MIDYTNRNVSTVSKALGFDAGLRDYMIKIYNYMTGALILTGLIAYFASSSEGFMSLLFNPQGGVTGFGMIMAFAPLAFVLALSFGIEKMSFETAQMVFWGYAATMGISLSSIFLVYTGESITRVFFITASIFGGMSLYGYTTKRDLTAIGSFLVMGLFGVLFASIINIFMHSTAITFITSIMSVIIFIGMTAFDTQRLKTNYMMLTSNGDSVNKAALMGALTLYLDFINLFIQLLRFFGQQRRD